MRIGFDARMISHPGIGRYISSLLPELVRQGAEDEFVVFGDPAGLVDIGGALNTEIVEWKAPVYSAWEQFLAPYGRRGLDLLHVPHFNVPLLWKGPMVVTIHDLIYLLFPGAAPSPLARHYASYMIRAALSRSARVISVSGHTKNDLLKRFGESYAPKIEVIHEAASKIFCMAEDKTRFADVRTRYRLSENIILYVGSVKPHKNVETLLEAFDLLKKWGLPHQLVICGRWDKKEDRLKDKLKKRDIRYIGEVPTDDLVALYNMADVLVHLSLYEGFGLTALEAMRCGTPVVVSDSSSLPEVVGESAYVVSPRNVEQIADVVYNILINPELREGMVERGFKRVKEYSWERTALKTLKAYRRTVSGIVRGEGKPGHGQA